MLDAKLVAEQSHLLPKVRGSERLAQEAEAEKMVVDPLEEKMAERAEKKVPVALKQKILVGGGVVEEGMDVD